VRLLPIEEDRLTVFLAAELARRRRVRGLQLTQPEAVALIADEMHEAARSGAGYNEVVKVASQVLTEEDVLPGVPSLIPSVRVECLFDDGMRLVIAAAPIQPAGGAKASTDVVPGRRIPGADSIEVHPGATRVTVLVVNTSSDVIWVGSHFPFFEVNRGLRFKRELAWGRHLDLPAGDAMRFGPGEQKPVTLLDFGGHRVIRGFNGLTEGKATKARLPGAMRRAKARGFADAESGK
jgi:urease subunit gamma/beta